jgi:hypothetical protein
VALLDGMPTQASLQCAAGGRQRIVWNGLSDDGHSVRTGVYFASLQTDDVHVVGRLLLLV